MKLQLDFDGPHRAAALYVTALYRDAALSRGEDPNDVTIGAVLAALLNREFIELRRAWPEATPESLEAADLELTGRDLDPSSAAGWGPH